MANFTAVFESLAALDASVTAVEDKIDELQAGQDDSEDQSNIDAIKARVDSAKDALDAAVAS